ncbi:hypothetical protein CDIK_3772, partial [Cucumispora dikerogammari]
HNVDMSAEDTGIKHKESLNTEINEGRYSVTKEQLLPEIKKHSPDNLEENIDIVSVTYLNNDVLEFENTQIKNTSTNEKKELSDIEKKEDQVSNPQSTNENIENHQNRKENKKNLSETEVTQLKSTQSTESDKKTLSGAEQVSPNVEPNPKLPLGNQSDKQEKEIFESQIEEKVEHISNSSEKSNIETKTEDSKPWYNNWKFLCYLCFCLLLLNGILFYFWAKLNS